MDSTASHGKTIRPGQSVSASGSMGSAFLRGRSGSGSSFLVQRIITPDGISILHRKIGKELSNIIITYQARKADWRLSAIVHRKWICTPLAK